MGNDLEKGGVVMNKEVIIRQIETEMARLSDLVRKTDYREVNRKQGWIGQIMGLGKALSYIKEERG